MEVPCPNCDHPLIVGDGIPLGETSNMLETISGVDCPNCGFVALQNVPGEDEIAGRTLSYGSAPEFGEATEIGHFRLMHLLGHGGFGTVWLASDVNLERLVALKLPNSRNKDLANLLHEAQAAAHLRHPNIVSIYEVGTEDGQVFIASEYIDGMTLRDLLTSGKPAVGTTVELSIAIAEALQHAHSNHIVHRDVKPANILLNSAGQPFVTDFGLAKRVTNQSTESTISSEGQILGTARYMSPEQASGRTRETDHRSDIYAVGVILFEMLTGHVPFRGNMRAVLQQKIFDDPPSPRSLDTSIPRDLETICLKCLERDPEKRYSSAGDLAQELRRFRDGEPILARPVSRPERVWRWCRRRPMIASLMLSLFTSLIVGLAGVTFYWLRAAHSAGLLRESLYRAQMTLAADYLAHADIRTVRQALKMAYDGQPPDLRGFEWYYYNAQADPFEQIVDNGDHVVAVAVSADGHRLASLGREDQHVRIWDTAAGTLIGTLPASAGRVTCLAFSPQNSQLATGSADGWVRFWNPMSADSPLRQVKHGPPVAFICFSPDGRRLLSSGASGAVRMWDVNTEVMIAAIPSGQSEIKDVRYSRDGTYFAVATADGRVRIRDSTTNDIIHVLGPNDHLESLAISDDGTSVVVGTLEGDLRFWTADDGKLVHKMRMLRGLIGGLTFLNDDALLAMATSSGELALLDLQQFRVVSEVHSHYLTDGVVQRTADGRHVVVGSGEGSVRVLETDKIVQPTICWHDSSIRGILFVDNQHLLAVSADGAVRDWDTETGESKELVSPGNRTVTRMAASDVTGLFAIATDAPAIEICAIDGGELRQDVAVHGKGVVDLAFSPDGTLLAIAERDGTARVIRAAVENEEPVPLTGLKSAALAVNFTSDGKWLIVACNDKSIVLVDPATGLASVPAITLEDIPRAVEFCPATGTIAIGTDAGSIVLVELDRRQVRDTIRAHTSRINVLTVLPDGHTLVTGGRDRALRLWDTESAEQLTFLLGHVRQVFCLAASPDGQTLCSGDLEGAIRIWRAPRHQ